jgi:hypothetical protein
MIGWVERSHFGLDEDAIASLNPSFFVCQQVPHQECETNPKA